MENFILYLFKSALWIVVFWLIYSLFLRKEIFFGFNRAYLLAGLVAPFGLAFCQYRYAVNIDIPFVTVPVSVSGQHAAPVPFAGWTVISIICVYLLGLSAVLLHHLAGLSKINKLIKREKTHSKVCPKIIEIPEIQSSFSFFGYVFIDRQYTSEVEKQLIIEHETAHIEQKHWLDILLAQIVCSLQWFNPFAWLYLQSVKQNHEFLADCSVIRKGYSPAKYQAVLINSTLKAPVFVFANSFAYYNKFKRITMMKKNVSKPAKKLAVLLLVPAMAAFLWAFAKPEYYFSATGLQKTENSVNQDTVSVVPADASKSKTVTVAPDKVRANKPEKAGKEVLITGKVLDKDGKAIPGATVVIEGTKTGTVTDMDGKFSITGLKGRMIDISYIGKDTEKIKIFDNGEDTASNFIVKMKDEKDSENEVIVETENKPLLIVDGKEITQDINKINPDQIESVSVLKDKSAIEVYGIKGKNGVVVITTKKK